MAVAPSEAPQRFGQAMRAIFEPLGGMEIPDIPREMPRQPPDFSGRRGIHPCDRA